jgi:AcrR family transcriptional regulator
MLAAAYELFSTQGYAPTTLPAIANAAEVHVQTLHYTFHTKANLLVAVITAYAAGEPGAPPVMERSWIQGALANANGAQALALAVEHGTEIYRRVAPLNEATQTAVSTEPQVAEFASQIAAARRAGMRTLVTSLAGKHELAPGLDIERATDVHYLLHSHETYLGLVIGAGWSMEEYKAWLYLTLCEQLLKPRPRRDVTRAANGMSFHAALRTWRRKPVNARRYPSSFSGLPG